ncbi:MAG: elongation factor Ts [Candidatus Shapirobacteria bacterium]
MDNKIIFDLVKKIRGETSYSIGEIKIAVEKAEGDEKKAKEFLKELGFKQLEKRADKEVHQGRIATYTHSTGKIGVMVELLCETDFVAKNDEFVNLTRDLCLQVTAMDPESSEELLKMDFIKDPSQKVSDLIAALAGKFGENVKLGRIARFEI